MTALLLRHAYSWCVRRMIFPMTAAQAVRVFFKVLCTELQRFGETQSSSPPLVWASASRMRSVSGVLFHSAISFAVSRFCRVPPGTQSLAISARISGLIAGTAVGAISAPTPLARHIEARWPSRPNPVTSTVARDHAEVREFRADRV